MVSQINNVRPKLPPWIRVKVSAGENKDKVESLLGQYKLHTVCKSAKCPNLCECWHRQTATFMILGDECTRNCTFCAVNHSRKPAPPDAEEPAKIAEAAKAMDLKYVVITSVTRDDLPDGGAAHFAKTISEIKMRMPKTKVEVLTPDFAGNLKNLKIVTDAGPDVFNHNMETVERLSSEIRSGADFRKSLTVLKSAYGLSNGRYSVKSGVMAGLGETDMEIEETICEIRNTGADMLTIGQYLPPTQNHRKLDRYIHPDTFAVWKSFAEKLGFRSVASGPLVRSSYNAANLFS